jgi:hypothetical protein
MKIEKKVVITMDDEYWKAFERTLKVLDGLYEYMYDENYGFVSFTNDANGSEKIGYGRDVLSEATEVVRDFYKSKDYNFMR